VDGHPRRGCLSSERCTGRQLYLPTPCAPSIPMPYRTIENMTRRGEKIAPFLTVENLVGLMISGTIGYVLKAGLEGIWQFVLLAGCMGLGYLATMEIQGMARYQRVLYRLRGSMVSLARGRVITPTDLPGNASQTNSTVMQRDGLVRLRPDMLPTDLPTPLMRVGTPARITHDLPADPHEQERSEESHVYSGA
jgi:hypothetical protein